MHIRQTLRSYRFLPECLILRHIGRIAGVKGWNATKYHGHTPFKLWSLGALEYYITEAMEHQNSNPFAASSPSNILGGYCPSKLLECKRLLQSPPDFLSPVYSLI
ncbi:hypothetical protein TNCV_3683391 [Trichonephila clavipes]|nr:hypothetical protein TNCV_3683391 [Trichonephila clavipes]